MQTYNSRARTRMHTQRTHTHSHTHTNPNQSLHDLCCCCCCCCSCCVQILPFPLDGFQQEALQKLIEGLSVVVCAPTGAGKTAIAEAAAAATLARGQRVIYTTPLKVLVLLAPPSFRIPSLLPAAALLSPVRVLLRCPCVCCLFAAQ